MSVQGWRSTLAKFSAAARRDVRQSMTNLVLYEIIASSLFPMSLRTVVLRLAGHQLHRTATVSPRVFLGARTGLTMGRNSFINYGSFLDLVRPVVIGNGVAISYEVMLVTGTHDLGPSSGRSGRPTGASILIEDGVWIGARSVILPGIRIGRGAVIAAGSVVTGDCDADTLYAGVPAVAKRRI